MTGSLPLFLAAGLSQSPSILSLIKLACHRDLNTPIEQV